MSKPRQEDLVRFLQEPAAYPHGPKSVDNIQTHISILAIAPPYVYKLKKPVRTNEPLFNRRRAGGQLLEGHGDLRLEHIHVTETAVRIFDCIEFSKRLRCIDTANEVAFLAMDLDYHDRPDLASQFAGCIAEKLADRELGDLLDFYKCYRACVRGKVEGLRSREPEVPAGERKKSRERAVRYFRLALNFAVKRAGPVVLVVMGRIGSGKSTVARLLADARLENFDRINRLYEKPDALEDAHHREVPAENSPEATAGEVLGHLAAYKHGAAENSPPV